MKKIPLTQGKFTKVDNNDFILLSKMKWYSSKDTRGNYRALGWVNGKNVTLSRFIMKPPINLEVDHINHDTLDNRRSNLRVCSRSENNRNKSKIKTNTSGYKGVSFKAGRWVAYIGVNVAGKRKNKFLGACDKKEDAYMLYCEASKIYHGDFAHL